VPGGEDQFGEVGVRLLRSGHPDAPAGERATARLRITVKDAGPRKAGRRFSNATMEPALAGYAGFHTTTPPSAETAFGVCWPALVPAELAGHAVVLPGGATIAIPPAAPAGPGERASAVSAEAASAVPAEPLPAVPAELMPAVPAELPPAARAGTALAARGGSARRVPPGLVCSPRSGGKGGNANVGLRARDHAGYPWLRGCLAVRRLRELLAGAADLGVRRFGLPDPGAINFVIAGLPGADVAASARPGPQAKGPGGYLHSRLADVPAQLLAAGHD
jgi:hypothetical protein